MLNKNLRYLRESRNLKQDEMQATLGLQGSKWSDYERGKAKPPVELIIKIAEFFDVDIKRLVLDDLENVHLNVSAVGNFTKKNVQPSVQRHVHLTPSKANYVAEDQDKLKIPEESGLFWRNKYIALLEKQAAKVTAESAIDRLEDISGRVLAIQVFLLKHASEGPCSQFESYEEAAEFLGSLEEAIGQDNKKDTEKGRDKVHI